MESAGRIDEATVNGAVTGAVADPSPETAETAEERVQRILAAERSRRRAAEAGPTATPAAPSLDPIPASAPSRPVTVDSSVTPERPPADEPPPAPRKRGFCSRLLKTKVEDACREEASHRKNGSKYMQSIKFFHVLPLR